MKLAPCHVDVLLTNISIMLNSCGFSCFPPGRKLIDWSVNLVA